MTPTISPMSSAAPASALMLSRELAARATASRLAADPRSTCMAIAPIAPTICSENLVASRFIAREPSAAPAASSDALRTVSRAARMSSALPRSTSEPSTIVWMPASVAHSSSLDIFARLTRRAACLLRSTSMRTRSRRCCSRNRSASMSRLAVSRSISLRCRALSPGLDSSSAQTSASIAISTSVSGRDIERATSAASPVAMAAAQPTPSHHS